MGQQQHKAARPVAAAAAAADSNGRHQKQGQEQQQQQQPSRLPDDGLGRPLLSVAPMMDWTDVHWRQLARLISRRTWLWTEMVVDNTIIHTPYLDRYLWFPPEQHPIVLQLGGSDPSLLRRAAATAAAYGYDEVNLNCGCPSDRVAGAGCFGASMMLQPELVGDCMAAIAAGLADGGAGGTRISVKCRLGVDDADSYEQLAAFVRTVAERGGVTQFVIHARKCLLAGLSPAQNRSVPPLRHDWVWALKRDFPGLSFQLNGGVTTTLAAGQALALAPEAACGVGPGALDGVMVGRAAYNDPWNVLGDADVSVFGADSNAAVSRRQVVQDYCVYADGMIGRWRTREDGSFDPGVRALVKPLLNLFHGERGGRRWKNEVDAALRGLAPASVSALMDATLSALPDDVLDAPPRSAAASAEAAAAASGAPCVPYALGVQRLAVPEDCARGERERPSKGKKAAAGSKKAAAVLQQQQQQGEEQQQQQDEQQHSALQPPQVEQQQNGAGLAHAEAQQHEQQQPAAVQHKEAVAAVVAAAAVMSQHPPPPPAAVRSS